MADKTTSLELLILYKNILRDIENYATIDFDEDLLVFIKETKKFWLEDFKEWLNS